MSEPKSIHAAEDWGVVFQSVPSKNKREIVKRLEEIFEIEKRDAEQILANLPLILVDNLSFGLATRIKKFFQKIGATVETTNHEMIKKNCFQVFWPQTPDLSFFMKSEMGAAEPPARDRKNSGEPEPPSPVLPGPGKTGGVTETLQVPEPPAREVPLPPPSPIPELPAADLAQTPASEVPPAPSDPDSDWARRAKELNEKLQKIQEEKQLLQDQQAQVAEKVKSDFQQRIDLEKKKSDEIAKAYEDLKAHAKNQEALTQEGEAWRSKAMLLGEKVRELETDLTQRSSVLQGRVSDLEKNFSAAQHELETCRQREQESLKKCGSLEREIQEMKGILRTRDTALAQFEKQITEFAEKAQRYESLRQEHAQLVQERAGIREEYDARLAEQELRLAKVEEEHRRHRSRSDRKNAAATRELGEYIRAVDSVRQGLQKLILFLGSESAVLDNEKKSPLRSPLTRGPDTPISDKA